MNRGERRQEVGGCATTRNWGWASPILYAAAASRRNLCEEGGKSSASPLGSSMAPSSKAAEATETSSSGLSLRGEPSRRTSLAFPMASLAVSKADMSLRQLYKNRSSRKINSQRLFSIEWDFSKTFSLTEKQFSGKTYFYTIASRSSILYPLDLAASSPCHPTTSFTATATEML